MDNAIAASPALPSKDRGGWLIAFGIIEILLATLSLLLGTFALIDLLFSKPQHVAGMPAGGAARRARCDEHDGFDGDCLRHPAAAGVLDFLHSQER